MCLCAKLLQSYPTLCDPMDCSLPGSSVHSIPQASILEWVAMPSSRASSQPRDWNHVSFVSCLFWQTGSLPLGPPGKSTYLNTLNVLLYIPGFSVAAAKSLQSCLILCDPIDGSPPGFPIPGILQARTLEWVAISFSNAWKWKVKVKSIL